MRKGLSRNGWWISGALILLAVLGAWKLGFDLNTFKGLAPDLASTASKYAHPAWQDPARLLRLLGETVAMGVLGTVLSMILAIPATAFAAKNVAPNGFLFAVTRQLMSFFRSMPDALLALLLVQGLGLGPFPGALALGLHSGGFIGKNLSEKVERIDPKILEGLRSCGAGWFQIVRFGAWPTIEREILADGLFAFDRNIRVAATLGLVGAGGIGVELMTDLRTFHEQEAASVIFLIMALVVAVDAASTFARKRME